MARWRDGQLSTNLARSEVKIRHVCIRVALDFGSSCGYAEMFMVMRNIMEQLVAFAKDNPAIYTGLLTAVSIVVSSLLVLFQMRRTFRWNRKVRTQDLCDNFLAPDLFGEWQILHNPLVHNRKKYRDLTDREQLAVRRLLSFLESVGILIRNEIVEPVIVFDHFSGIVPILYKCASDFIVEYREMRQDPRVFENFVELYGFYGEADARLQYHQSVAFKKAARKARHGARI